MQCRKQNVMQPDGSYAHLNQLIAQSFDANIAQVFKAVHQIVLEPLHVHLVSRTNTPLYRTTASTLGAAAGVAGELGGMASVCGEGATTGAGAETAAEDSDTAAAGSFPEGSLSLCNRNSRSPFRGKIVGEQLAC